MKKFLIEVADGKGGNGVFLVEHRGRALIVADRAQRRAVEATAGSERRANSLRSVRLSLPPVKGGRA